MRIGIDSGDQPALLEVEAGDPDPEEYGGPEEVFGTADYFDLGDRESLRPINWNLLTADEALIEWADLDAWVDWLRLTYGLPPTVVPPYWHRHDELIWELSALHTHWLNAYNSEGTPSGPLGWHRDFHEAKNRLREWVSLSGTRIDRDRPTRQTTWPGEPLREAGAEVEITDRWADFRLFVQEDVAARRAIEEQVRAAS